MTIPPVTDIRWKKTLNNRWLSRYMHALGVFFFIGIRVGVRDV